jgi:hypothetical protein
MANAENLSLLTPHEIRERLAAMRLKLGFLRDSL